MKRIVHVYCQQVGKHLVCLPQTRRVLLEGLERELMDLPEGLRSSWQKLEDSYGTVLQVAAELQEYVTASEAAAFVNRQRYQKWVLIATLLLTALLFFGVGLVIGGMYL